MKKIALVTHTVLVSGFTSVLLIICNTISAESLKEFSKRCENELETGEPIKGFKCSEGVEIYNNSFGEGCTSPPRLLFAEAITEQKLLTEEGCDKDYVGTRMGRIYYKNKDVEAVYNCRKYEDEGYPIDGNIYSDIAMIIHNKRSGKTCFFQDNLDGVDGDMPAPGDDEARSSWDAPQTVAESKCHTCHSRAPFIISRHVVNAFAQLDLLGDYTSSGPYSFVGPDFKNWETSIKAGNDNCAGACHYSTDLANKQHVDDGLWAVLIADVNTMMPPTGLSPYAVTRLPIATSFGSDAMWQSSVASSWIRKRAPDTAGLNPSPASGNSQNYLLFKQSNTMQDVSLTSKAFIARPDSKFSFDYHISGVGGALSVEVHGQKSLSDEAQFYKVWKRASSQNSADDPWKRVIVNLSCYTGIIQVRLTVSEGDSNLGSIALDNLHIYNGNPMADKIFSSPSRKDARGLFFPVAAHQENAEQFCNEEGFLRVKKASAVCQDGILMTSSFNGRFWNSIDSSSSMCGEIYQSIECAFN